MWVLVLKATFLLSVQGRGYHSHWELSSPIKASGLKHPEQELRRVKETVTCRLQLVPAPHPVESPKRPLSPHSPSTRFCPVTSGCICFLAPSNLPASLDHHGPLANTQGSAKPRPWAHMAGLVAENIVFHWPHSNGTCPHFRWLNFWALLQVMIDVMYVSRCWDKGNKTDIKSWLKNCYKPKLCKYKKTACRHNIVKLLKTKDE